MNSWLYPISKRSGYYFSDRKGRRVRTSYESFRDFVVTGAIADDEWGVHQNFDSVEVGDEVFIYTGDSDRGIIAYAKVTGKKSQRRRTIILRLDSAKTKLLLADPVPAARVRPLIPPPRSALLNVKRGVRRLRALLPWTSQNEAESRTKLGPLRLKRRTVVTAKIRRGTQQKELFHDSILSRVVVYLKSKGFEIGTRSFGRLRADLVAVRGSSSVIVEGKIIQPKAGRLQAREALGQLLEYSWLLRQHSERRSKAPALWIAFSARPHREVQAFLADQKVIVSWPTATGLSFLRDNEPA